MPQVSSAATAAASPRYRDNALTKHALRAAENGAIIVCMRINRTRCDGFASRDNLLVSHRIAKIADGDYAVVLNADIGTEARCAGAIQYGGITDDQITAQPIWTDSSEFGTGV
jgi:hypothetical protein